MYEGKLVLLISRDVNKKHWYVCNSMYALHSRAVAFTLNFLSHNFLMCT